MKKILKITGISFSFLFLILVFMLLFPFIFRAKFENMVRQTVRKSLKTEMSFSHMKISFFNHFPKLTLSLEKFYLMASYPYPKDTLARAEEISFSINVMSVIRGPIRISGVYVERGKVMIRYNETGRGNLDVFRTKSDTTEIQDTTGGGTADIRIESIRFRNTDLIYSDNSIPVAVICNGLNYQGKSDITSNILKLNSDISITSLDVFYDHTQYLKSKPVKANLATTVNLSSLEMKFDKNDLLIKDVPFEFRGDLNFRKTGYSLFLSLYSMYHDEWISGSVYLVSTERLWLSVKADINMDLGSWAQRFGLQEYDVKGKFGLKLKAQGEYRYGQDASGTYDIISIPDLKMSATLKNGYFKYNSLPAAFENIDLQMNVASNGNDYRKTNIEIENLKASFLKNNIEGYFKIRGLQDLPVECNLRTDVNLGELGKVIPLDSLTLQGLLHLDMNISGNYAHVKKKFPVTTADISLKNGYLMTKYQPIPLENMNITASVRNTTGTVAGTSVNVKDLRFTFNGNPFTLKADLSNPDNLSYNVVTHGTIDVAGIYKMFSREGMSLAGMITADLNLRGKQQDAMAGRIEKLHNSGILKLQNIAFTSDYLPHPLVLKSGIFRFDNDKIWFEKFISTCGKTSIELNGNLSNVVNYALSEGQILKGDLDFTSDFVNVNDFMTSGTSAENTASSSASSQSSDLVEIPSDLDFMLNAGLKKVLFEGLDINDLKGKITISPRSIKLDELKFNLIGCTVDMNAGYSNMTSDRAAFDFQIKAEEFDVQRAYQEIQLFRTLVSSAEKCEGIVSIDYKLKGRLTNGFEPIYPSLEGGGVISVKKVKVMGLSIFNAMSKNLGKEKLKNPDLSKVDFNTTIKNNIITLEQTKIRVSGFRLKMSGETSFDGKLNIKTRVGLPPLGIIGIPIRILGTSDNPKFKYGRGNNDEALDETQYSDEMPDEVVKALQNSKDEDGDDGNQ